MQLHVAVDQLPPDSPARPLFARVLQLMGHVVEEGRNAVRGFRSVDRDTRDLEQAFSKVPQELDVKRPIGFRVMVAGDPRPLRPVIHDEVYSIGREALVNAFRHSGANGIAVELEYSSSRLRILVSDDGCGIDPTVLQSGLDGHWGLAGMRERAVGIGAKLKVARRAGGGTEVELCVAAEVAFDSQSARSAFRWLQRLNGRSKEAAAGAERHVELVDE
jgi:signal transduction histidine kinase